MRNIENKENLPAYIQALEARYGELRDAYTELAARQKELKASNNFLTESILTKQAGEKRFMTIIDNSPGALFLSNLDGSLLEVNRTACEMFGYSEEEFRHIGRHMFIDSDKNTLMELLDMRRKRGKAKRQFTAVKKNGEHFRVDVSSVVFRDVVTGEDRACSVMTDITERVKIENALVESEKYYKHLFNLNPLPMWIYDHETNGFLDVNEAAIHHYGYSREQFLSMSILDIRPSDELGRLQSHGDKIQDELTKHHGYWKHIKRNGDIINVEITAQLIDYSGRKAVLVLANDITQKIRMESKLIKSNRRLQSAQQIAQLGYWELNMLTLELYLSPQAYAILGLPLTETPIGYSEFFHMIHPDDVEIFKIHEAAVLKGQRSIHLEHRVILINGTVRTLVEIGSMVCDEAGIPILFEGTMQDITERKKAEQAIQDSERRMKNAQYVGGVGDWEYDCKTQKLLWSDELFRQFARDPALGAPELDAFISLYFYDDAERLRYNINDAIETGRSYELDLRLVLPDKPEAYHYSVGQVLRNDQGEIVKLYGVVQDITDRKLAEIRLNNERNQLRTLIDTLPDSIYIKDVEGRKTVTNLVDMQLMGASSDAEVIGKTDLDIFQNDIGISSYADDMHVIQTGEAIYNREECFTSMDGSKTWILTSKVPLRHPTGRVNGLLGIGRIITARKEAEEALRVSNERYIYATKATSDAIWDWDIVNDHLYWGEGYEKIFGYKIPDKVDNHILSFDNIHPNDRKHVFDGIDTLLASGELNWSSEYRYLKANGEYAFVEDKGIIIRDANGKAVRMIGAMQDVSERKTAEEAIKKTQDKFTTLVNTVDGIVWEADADSFAFTYVSKHAEKLLGYPTSDWTSDPLFWANHIHPDDREWAVAYCIKCTREKKEHQFEYRMIAADGRIVWLADFVTVLVEADQPVQLRGIMVDITERKKVEEALVKERKLLRILIDNLPDYIYVKDKDSRHIINNRANIGLLGFSSEEETLNKTIVELLGESIAGEFIKDDEQVLRSGEAIIDREEPILGNDGGKRWLLTTKIPFKDESDNITGLVGISRDITESKKTDEELKEKNSQLKKLSRHLQSIREEERKSLAREVHDELGQLASVVKMDIDWLTLRLPDLQGMPLKKMLHASATTELLLNTIRKIASTLRPSMLDELGLNASLAWQCKEFTALNSIPCVFEQVFDDEDMSNGVKVELFRICQESLTNIMRHAAATHVRVSINKIADGLRLSISDNGKGFNVKQMSNTLGLIGMRERVLSINGMLTIQSEAGKGTTICADIPKKMIYI